MTRVLHFIPTMGGGGAERELAHLAGALRALGTEVHVALVRKGPNFERLAESGAGIHPISIASNYDPRLPFRIDGILRRVRPDVVQTWITQMDVAAGWVASTRRIPWILAERASALCYRPTWKNRLRVAVARRADLVQANSVTGTHYWEDVQPRVPTKFIPSPVPVAEIERVSGADLSALGNPDGLPLVLFAGRFHPQKNVRAMLEAFALVLRERPVMVALCGEGPQGGDVRRWLVELGIESRVLMPGYVADIWSWMKSADVFVSVSHYEGRPNTVVEAAAAGCPLVVSDIPEHREFLQHGEHALVVDHHDPAAIARAIHDALDDREGARRRAVAAHAVVADWTLERIAAMHVSMYEDVLSRKTPVPRGER
jgi:glycosyltransferase involved in cell wall biosynthesis